MNKVVIIPRERIISRARLWGTTYPCVALECWVINGSCTGCKFNEPNSERDGTLYQIDDDTMSLEEIGHLVDTTIDNTILLIALGD